MVVLVIGFVLLYFFAFAFSVVDDISIAVFDKPLFIHVYLRPKKVTPEQEYILRQKFQFYKKLSEKHKIYFHHRLATFIDSYKFIPREDFQMNMEAETLISATYVMLTFGMRRYIINSFDKIIVYPEIYYTTQSGEYYKGEFNPRLKAVVFSWKDFVSGYEIDNDNLNLGIHEFSHAIHCHSLRSDDGSSLAFKKQFEIINRELNNPATRQRLIDSPYFRIYAYTNAFEFIAVIIEHYFETPEEFKKEFPELFNHVSKMLNNKC